MGFFELVWKIQDTIEDIKDGVSDISDTVKDNMERKKDAKRYIQDAKDIVAKADRVYERTYDDVNFCAVDVEYQLRKHQDYKKSIASELGNDIGKTLKKFNSFNIDLKVIETPRITEKNSGISIFSIGTSSIAPQADVRLPNIFDMFISDDDYYEAVEMKNQARRYRADIDLACEKLNHYKSKMLSIGKFITSEEKVLDSLMKKLRNMNRELSDCMKKDVFTKEEAEYLKAIHSISENMMKTLSTEFLRDGFYITQKYHNAFESLKEIDNSLPLAPSIDDQKTKNAIKSILDGIIVY